METRRRSGSQFEENRAIPTLERVLRYEPGLIRRLEDLLTATASHLPRVVARQVIETPDSGPLALPLEGTVVFADIDGFTPLSERFAEVAAEEGAEQLTDLANRFLDILITTTIPYGGDLQKFGGDAGMLLFSGEQHALRAIAASLKVQEAMRERLGAVQTAFGHFPLQIAIGLGSGRMIGMGLGNAAGREWLLTGDPLRTMGLAQSIAPPGGVVIDASTLACCADDLVNEQLERDLYLVQSVHQSPDARPLEPLPAPPKGQEARHLDWLISRMDALAPYLAPDLLRNLMSALNPTQIQPWSDHRQVTIMMVSLAALPDLSHLWGDPGALQQAVIVQNTIFTSARDIVYRYDGIVNKIGAAPQGAYMMVLFGAPTAHEDDPLRAVLAALELQEHFGSFPLRIGINTGFVFAGDVGTAERREYTVMGDAVNLAYRLMSTCPPGEVWLGPDTAQHPAVTHRVEGVLNEPRQFKGKRHLIAPYVAQGIRQMLVGGEADELPLLGREEELVQLQSAIDNLMSGQAQVVTLSGPAGIGKTRLVHAVAAMADTAGIAVYSGAAPSYGAHLPYAAWETPMRALLGLHDTPPARQAEALQIALNAQALGEWAALLAPIVGVDVVPSPEIAALSPAMREQQRRMTVHTLWENAASRQRPCLLILENAQWMPSPSLELLDELIAQAAAPLMVLITYREDPASEERWDTHAHIHRIALSPLSRQVALSLARSVIHSQQLPREVERWIVKSGEGIPLFTIEAVRTLIVSGVLEQQNGDWILSHPLEEAPLPETAYGLLQSRIDQLEPPSRHLLRAATVVGEQMTVPMLVAGYGEEPRPVIQRRLPQLRPLGLVPGDEQGETLIFRQPLIREVAYRGLPFRIRRLVHERLAGYLNANQERATSNWLTLLAYHAFEGQEWGLAARSNLELGQRALDNYLTDQAVQALERVLQAVETGQLAAPDTSFAAHHLLGETLSILGRYDEALHHLEQARKLLPAVPTERKDIGNLAHLEYHTASVLETQGHYAAAFEAVERGLHLPGIEDRLEGAQLYLMGAGLHHRRGQAELSQRWGERSVVLSEKIDASEARKVQARALYLLAFQTSQHGDPEKALTLGQQSLTIYQKLQDLLGEINARTNLLLINLALGDWNKAVEHGELGFALAQRIHHTEGEARLAANLGEVYRYQGNIAQARTFYAHTLDIAQESGITYGVALIENNLAALALMENRMDEAEAHLHKAEALFDKLGANMMLPELYRLRATLVMARGDAETALDWAERSLQEAEEQGERQEASRTFRLLTEIHLARNVCSQAEETLRQALETARANQDRYGEMQATFTQARWHRQCGNPTLASNTLKEAVNGFTALGAHWDLEKANDLQRAWQGSLSGQAPGSGQQGGAS